MVVRVVLSIADAILCGRRCFCGDGKASVILDNELFMSTSTCMSKQSLPCFTMIDLCGSSNLILGVEKAEIVNRNLFGKK